MKLAIFLVLAVFLVLAAGVLISLACLAIKLLFWLILLPFKIMHLILKLFFC